MSALGLLLVGAAILVGLAGIVVPVLPGALLVLGAILVWALQESTTVAWITFALAATFIALSQVLKYAVPGRRMRAHGVPNATLAAGALLGGVGFFVVPVVGLLLGFVLGVYGAERRRLRDHESAWRSTVLALKAVGVSMLIELAGSLLAAGAWLAAVLAAD